MTSVAVYVGACVHACPPSPVGAQESLFAAAGLQLCVCVCPFLSSGSLCCVCVCSSVCVGAVESMGPERYGPVPSSILKWGIYFFLINLFLIDE